MQADHHPSQESAPPNGPAQPTEVLSTSPTLPTGPIPQKEDPMTPCTGSPALSSRADVKGAVSMWKWNLGALVLSLLALGIRCLNYEQIFTANGCAFMDTDTYYHLWRTKLWMGSWPHVPLYDAFINFPEGLPVPYPPGFDFLLLLGALGDPGRLAVWGALISPVLGAVATFLIYRLGARVFGPLQGILAAFFFAFMRGAAHYSLLGRPDHHSLIPVVMIALFLSLTNCLLAADRKRRILWGLAVGLLSAASVISWQGTPPLYFLPAWITLAVLGLARPRPEQREAAWVTMGAMIAFVAIAVALFTDFQHRPYYLMYPSLFSLVAFGLMGLSAVALQYGRAGLCSLLALSCLLIGLTVAFPGLRDPITHGFIMGPSKGDPSLTMATEAAPILLRRGAIDLSAVTDLFSYVAILTPILCLALLVWLRHRFRENPGALLLGSFAPLSAGITLFQIRFIEYSSPALALLFAWFLGVLLEQLRSFYRTTAHRARALVYASVALPTALAALHPLYNTVGNIRTLNLTATQESILAFGREVKQHTPDPRDAQGEPRYGVLATWITAEPFLYSAERPVVASAFGMTSGNLLAFNLLLSHDGEGAYRTLADHRIRYALVSSNLGELEPMISITGKEQNFFDVEKVVDSPWLKLNKKTTRPEFFKTVQTRLYFFDGTIPDFDHDLFESLPHFRLHMESSSTISHMGERISHLKLFESVPGARLVGEAQPNTEVLLKASIRTNREREFLYRSKTIADRNGSFGFVVPYPSTSFDCPTHAEGPYRLKNGEHVVEVYVGEGAAMHGYEVAVPPFEAGIGENPARSSPGASANGLGMAGRAAPQHAQKRPGR